MSNQKSLEEIIDTECLIRSLEEDGTYSSYYHLKSAKSIASAIRSAGYIHKDEVDISVEDLSKIILFIRRNMFLPENNKREELRKMILGAIAETKKALGIEEG